MAGDDQSWRQRAACRGLSPAVFYSEDPHREAMAKAICARCPAIGDCRRAGEAEDWGIWGGRSAEERHQGREQRRSGPAPIIDTDQLSDLLLAADPDRPALEQILAGIPVAPPTAYRYLDRARRAGLVEKRKGRLYPARR